jgi:predicted GIY-YIG superfamily endonuclease
MTKDTQSFTVCGLRCSDGSLFATITDESPGHCVAEHNAGRGRPFAIGRRPVCAAFAVDTGSDVNDALGVVWAIRELTRAAKERLCGDCPVTLRRVMARGEELGQMRRGVFQTQSGG